MKNPRTLTLRHLRVLGMLSLVLTSHGAMAQTTPAFTLPATFDTASSNSVVTVGYSFTVGSSSLTVTDLGYFDFQGDGLSFSHTVSLWDQAGTTVGSAVVPSGLGAPLTDSYRYIALGGKPITLEANTSYTIGATLTPNSDFFPYLIDGATVGAASGVSLGAARSATTGDTFSTSDMLGTGHYLTPNFKYQVNLSSAAPEPSALVLLIIGGGLMLVRRR